MAYNIGQMIYLLDKFDFDLLRAEKEKHQYIQFDFWECPEEKVVSWLRFERTRSIFSKEEIIGLFKVDFPIQMVSVKEIRLRKFDKIIVWTPKGRYFVFKVTGFI